MWTYCMNVKMGNSIHGDANAPYLSLIMPIMISMNPTQSCSWPGRRAGLFVVSVPIARNLCEGVMRPHVIPQRYPPISVFSASAPSHAHPLA